MSWFFGVVGKYSAHDLHLFKKIHSSPIHLVQTEKIYVAAGGLKETCLFGSFPEISNSQDIMTLRTRYPNMSAEQSCGDEILVSYMPYAQPSFVKKALNLPAAEKKNGRLFRRTLQQNCPALTRFPLVTEATVYPYPFTTIPASLWTKTKHRLGYSFRDNTPQKFLDTLEEFIQDTVHSNETKQFEFYDYPRILKMVSEYFRGDKQYVNELDWWLAFEIWRQKLYCD